MIEFDKVKAGDKVKVVGQGAPGFASLGDELEITLGDELEITKTASDRVWANVTMGMRHTSL